MPDVPEPHRRSRGPGAGHLWSGQAGPEAPPPAPAEPHPRGEAGSKTSVFRSDERDAPTAVLDSEPSPRREGRIWPKALAGGAASGLAVALAALAIGGAFDGDDGTPSATV